MVSHYYLLTLLDHWIADLTEEETTFSQDTPMSSSSETSNSIGSSIWNDFTSSQETTIPATSTENTMRKPLIVNLMRHYNYGYTLQL